MIMRYISIPLALAALLAAACVKQPAPSYPAALRASIESAALLSGTKTSYDSDDSVGEFVWNAGDRIAIHYSNGSYETVSVDPASGAVNAPSTASRQRDFYAVYPASAVADPAVAANYGNPTLQLTYPASYDISDIVSGSSTTRTTDFSPCPMVAVNSADSDLLLFYHVGGLLRLTLLSVRPATAMVTITFGTDVTGSYTVADPGSRTPTISTRGSAADNVVSFTLAGSAGIGTGTGPVVLNVPVPCGTYDGFRVEAFSAEHLPLGVIDVGQRLVIRRRYGTKFFLLFPETLEGDGIEGLVWN